MAIPDDSPYTPALPDDAGPHERELHRIYEFAAVLVRITADDWGKTSDSVTGLSLEVKSVVDALRGADQPWEGPAAESAYATLQKLRSSLTARAAEITDIKKGLEDAATAADTARTAYSSTVRSVSTDVDPAGYQPAGGGNFNITGYEAAIDGKREQRESAAKQVLDSFNSDMRAAAKKMPVEGVDDSLTIDPGSGGGGSSGRYPTGSGGSGGSYAPPSGGTGNPPTTTTTWVDTFPEPDPDPDRTPNPVPTPTPTPEPEVSTEGPDHDPNGTDLDGQTTGTTAPTTGGSTDWTGSGSTSGSGSGGLTAGGAAGAGGLLGGAGLLGRSVLGRMGSSPGGPFVAGSSGAGRGAGASGRTAAAGARGPGAAGATGAAGGSGRPVVAGGGQGAPRGGGRGAGGSGVRGARTSGRYGVPKLGESGQGGRGGVVAGAGAGGRGGRKGRDEQAQDVESLTHEDEETWLEGQEDATPPVWE